MNREQQANAIRAIEAKDNRITEEQAVEIARILGDVDSFHYFDRLAGSGSRMADDVHAWKVRQARNMRSADGKRAVFFDALAAVSS
jgi:hypothetical protein